MATCGGGASGGAATVVGSYVKNILSTSTGNSWPFASTYFPDTSADITGVQLRAPRA